MGEEIYIIDGSAYIYRAYHAIAPLSNSKGVPTHAVLGFINMVKRLIREKAPKYLAIAFDTRGPVFRHEIYDKYKANRPPMPDDLRPQIPYIKEFVAASNILNLEELEVEADDIIATVTKKFTALGHKVVIVSGDKDLLQLVSSHSVMWDPMKDTVTDPEGVLKKYAVRIDQLLDYFSLVGDSADNIPGVPGVGPKTAQKLIDSYGSLDGLYENIDDLKKSKMKEKIIENKELAYLSRKLIRLKDDVPVTCELSDYRLVDADDETLRAIYEELGFTTLLKGVEKIKGVDVSGFITVRDTSQLSALVDELSRVKRFAIDTETTSLNARRAKLVGISISTTLENGWYIPLNHMDDSGTLVSGQLSEQETKVALLPFLKSDAIQKIGHNLKYDYTVLRSCWGVELGSNLADTLIAAHLLEIESRSLKLDDLCKDRGIQLTSFQAVVDGDKREDAFSFVDIDKATGYGCEDVFGALLLWKEFEPELTARGLEKLYVEVEMPLIGLLAEMESYGIGLDPEVLACLSKEFSEKLAILETEIYGLSGHEFNINSPKQLAEVLFVEQELPHGRKTKTGYSTDVKVLEKLSVKHELPRLVLRYRSLMKLLTTYVDKLAQIVDPETERIHTSFNQAVTATGRLSSSDPNLQNIPIRTEEGSRIRGAFVPADKNVFISADYSQIDLRVLAHYSQDHALLTAFNNGDDIHARTAAEIFSVSPLLVNSEMRRVAKSINFGIVYGMSAYGLSSQLGISRKDAQRFIDKYFRLYAGVKNFMEEIVGQAQELGYVTTLLGRRRRVPEIHAKNKTRREFSERMAINTPIQGTAADIIKLAMLQCRETIRQNELQANMLLQIHDELVFEIAESDADLIEPVIKEVMEKSMKLDVPLVVNIERGKSLEK